MRENFFPSISGSCKPLARFRLVPSGYLIPAGGNLSKTISRLQNGDLPCGALDEGWESVFKGNGKIQRQKRYKVPLNKTIFRGRSPSNNFSWYTGKSISGFGHVPRKSRGKERGLQ